MLSLGQEPRWHRFLVDRLKVGPEAQVLDVATGTGAVAEQLVLRRRCAVTGIDQSADMLAAAHERLDEQGLSQRVRLMEGEAEHLPFEDEIFDALTVTYLLRYVDDPAAVLAELARVVRPGGTIASLEFGVPSWAPGARGVERLHRGRPPDRRFRGRRARMVGRRAVPAPQHPGLLRAPPAGGPARHLPRRRHRRSAHAPHEHGRRHRHLGGQALSAVASELPPTARIASWSVSPWGVFSQWNGLNTSW